MNVCKYVRVMDTNMQEKTVLYEAQRTDHIKLTPIQSHAKTAVLIQSYLTLFLNHLPYLTQIVIHFCF